MNTKNLTVLYRVFGEFGDTEKVITYLLCEDRDGNRHLKYNDDQTFTKYDNHKIYTKYIYPWLNGVDCISEEYRVNVRRSIKCPHCDAKFYLEKQLEDDDFVNCTYCFKTTLNIHKIDEASYAEHMFYTVAYDVECQMVVNYCKDIDKLNIPNKYKKMVTNYLQSRIDEKKKTKAKSGDCLEHRNSDT